jgi:hypothetical protein
MDYKYKYEKYKKKYLELLNHFGGSNEIEKINDGLYISSKILSYIGPNKESGVDQVYFIFEKINDTNLNFWKYYNDDQEVKTSKMGITTTSGTQVYLIDGVSSFKYSLELYKQIKSEIWISYVSRNKDVYKTRKDKDIEMCVTVLMNKEDIITTHIGIFRNYLYFNNEKKPHKNLAVELHKFSGMMSNYIYGNKKYMITNPANHMRDIIIKYFKDDKLDDKIWLGDNNQRREMIKMIQDYEYDKKLLDNKENDITKYRSFDDYEIKSINEKIDKLQELSEILKKLDYNTFCEKIQEDRKLRNLLYDTDIEYVKYCENNLSLDNMKNEIKNILNDKCKYLYENKIKSEERYIKYKLENNYHPEDLNIQVPFDNINKNEIKIDDKIYNKPDWFQHKDLLNHISTIIIDIKTFKELW